MVTMFINIKALLFTKAFISRKTLAKLKHNYLLRGKYFLLCDNSIMGEPAHNLTLNYSRLINQSLKICVNITKHTKYLPKKN